MHRFFADDKRENMLIVTDPVDVHHARRVLRLREGDEVVMVWRQEAFRCRLQEIASEVAAEVVEQMQTPASAYSIHLIQGYPKGSRLDDVLRHGTEVGYESFHLVQMERSVAKIKDEKKKRMERILKDAALQSGGLFVPDLELYSSLSKVDFSVYDQVFFCYEEADLSTPFEVVGKKLAVVIGPEGGFTQEEADFLRRTGALEIRLGPRILRTETAPLVAAALLLSKVGVMG